MADLNYLWITFYSLFTIFTIHKICAAFRASEFLDRISGPALSPFQRLCLSLSAYTLIILLMSVEDLLFKDKHLSVVFLSLKVALAFALMYGMNSSYSSIFFILLADFFVRNCKTVVKAVAAAVLSTLYVLSSITNPFNRGPGFAELLTYYSSTTAFFIRLIQDFVFTATVMLFIVYMIKIMSSQEKEYDRIRSLNARLDEANADLLASNMKLEEYSREVELMSQARERNRLAKEIHDTLGHSLTGILTSVSACLTLLDISKEETRAQLNITHEAAKQGLTNIRRSVAALKDDNLHNRTLSQAVERVAELLEKTGAVRITLESNLGDKAFSDDEEDTVYRIVQECLTNAVRHGHAQNIRINIDYGYGNIHIRIEDDGVGCKDIHEGFGLTHMRERVELLGGSIRFDGSRGFLTEADIPIRWGQIK